MSSPRYIARRGKFIAKKWKYKTQYKVYPDVSDQKGEKMTSFAANQDYEEKSIKEMFERSILVQLFLMFIDIGLLVVRILWSLVQDVVDGIYLTLLRMFGRDGELMLLLDYILPFMYYANTN